MGPLKLTASLFRRAPSKRLMLRSLALGTKGGNRTITSSDGTPLEARRNGTGDPIVTVHGVLDGLGAYSMVELWLARTRAVTVYARRGRGASGDAATYGIDQEIADLGAVIADAAADGDATNGVHVVAHSYGAVIAMQAALAGVPMRSLVLYEPPLNGEAIDPDVIERLRAGLGEGRIDEMIRLMATELAGLTDDDVALAMKLPPVRSTLREGTKTLTRELDVIRACRWDGRPIAGIPTLVLSGELSEASVYPTDEQARGLADDVEIEILPGQRHLAMSMAPFDFIDRVTAFHDRH